jgi:hypothetical protein
VGLSGHLDVTGVEQICGQKKVLIMHPQGSFWPRDPNDVLNLLSDDSRPVNGVNLFMGLEMYPGIP